MANERRLIDMDETIKQLRDYADRKHINGHTDTANGILKAVSYIRNNMVRVDAVEVVRCEDCVHWNYGDCWRLELSRPDDFCSYGEAKSGTVSVYGSNF